jgi:surfeit locus 1 family protein
MSALRRWTFRPRWVTTVAALGFCALSIALGNWQLRRAAEKEAVYAERTTRAQGVPIMLPAEPVDPARWVWRRVVVRGEFVDERAILLDNRTRDGRAGFEVVTPLKVGPGAPYVLVNRGWIAAGRTRNELPVVRTPRGPVRIEGLAFLPPTGVFALGATDPGQRVWPHLDLARYREWSGLAIQPVVVLQTSDLEDGLMRAWPGPQSEAAKHSAYALQWYLFALISIILYVALNLKRKRTG